MRQLGPGTGIQRVLTGLLEERQFQFPVERAVYLTVLHRLFQSGWGRAAERWRRDVLAPGTEELQLHHLYRAMRWLEEVKGQVEEQLFQRRRDLFTELSLAFFHTTSPYFEGQGGESLGRHGHSKARPEPSRRDHRPDLKQLVLGAVLTQEGRPLASEVWPGNHTDVQALLPVVDRLRERFGLRQVCCVADRGMISQGTIQALEERGLEYILGARMRRQREVRQAVLGRAGRYQEVAENLRVKEVWVEGLRYVVCHNPQEAAKDAGDREAILQALEEQLQQGALQLIGNRGFRRYLRVEKGAYGIDARKVAADPLRWEVCPAHQLALAGGGGCHPVQAPVAGGAVLPGSQVCPERVTVQTGINQREDQRGKSR